jgi:hypothetical protein
MRFRLLAAALLAALPACSDDAPRDLSDHYHWAIVDGTDTLTFRWLTAELPVHVWVEDSAGLPAQISRGMSLWESTIGSGSYRAVTTTDSTTAQVIVRVAPIAVAAPPSVRRNPSAACQGETVVDTVASRFQLSIPIRINIEILGGSADSIQACLRRVAAHELGHSLGLFQHSPNTGDLMYIFPAVDAPSNRDGNTALTLYSTPRNMVPVRPPATAPRP